MKWIHFGLLAVATLLFSNAVFASSAQPLNLTMTGGIASVGGQHYVLKQDGSAAYASINGHTLNPQHTQLDYSLVVDVDGSSVTGHATIHLTSPANNEQNGGGNDGHNGGDNNGQNGATSSGQKIELDGKVAITGIVPAETFLDGSVIPSAFTGLFTGTVSIGESDSSVSLPLTLESPFINPFCGPIVIASLDAGNKIVIVTGYDAAKISYSSVQVLTISLAGSVGTTSVTAGSASLVTRAVEDLHAGTETEHGSISFIQVTPSLLDSTGSYSGKSIIPSASNCLTTYGFSPCTLDCTPFLPVIIGALTLNLAPLPSGLCTITGFISSGSFHTHGHDVHISGDYNTVWDIPAVSFGIAMPPPLGGSTITGSVSS